MNEQDPTANSSHDILRGSAWAALDETFFRLVQDSFSHDFCAGASAMLATNDNDLDTEAADPERPTVIQLPDQDSGQTAARRAARRRHPSNFRRF
jgi:hypothetical protein